MTAVVSKKIIGSLQQSANVEDILDDVARDTGITWSWSPGTVEQVFVMSGDLISLVKAKRQLKQLKEVGFLICTNSGVGARCSSVVRAMGRRIDPSWGGPIKLFIVPASAPRLV